jgi:type I restriction enzyme, S subunit
MKKVPLNEIISQLQTGSRPKNMIVDRDGIPSLGGEHLNKEGGFNFSNIKYISDEYFKSLKNGIIKKDDILIVKDGATTGKVSFVSGKFPFKNATLNEHVFRIGIDIQKAFPKYIFFYLFSRFGQHEILKDYRGATIGGISRNFPEKVKIPLPPLPEQKRIAAILDKADALRQKNKQLLTAYDELLQSVFLDMFGDPVKNPKGWTEMKVSEIAETRLGKMLDKKTIRGDNLKPYLKNTNVLWFEFSLDDLLKMDFDEKDQLEFQLKYGDVLMCEGGEIGRCAVWKEDMKDVYFQKAIHRIRLDKNLMLPDFFVRMFWFYAMNGGLNKFLGAAKLDI